MKTTSRIGLGAVAVVAALALWELLALWGIFGSALPSATTAATELVALLGEGDTWVAILDTVLISIIGLVIGAVVGIVLGVLIGVFDLLASATRVALEFLKPIPPIVVLPIAVLVFGPNFDMGVFLVALGCGVQILVQTAAGVLETEPVAVDTARSYRLSSIERLWRIILPSAMPAIVSALRIAAPGALIVTVVAGLFGGAPGLGKSLFMATKIVDTPKVFALVLLLGVLGILVQTVSNQFEKRVLHWHSSVREAAAA